MIVTLDVTPEELEALASTTYTARMPRRGHLTSLLRKLDPGDETLGYLDEEARRFGYESAEAACG